MPVCGWRIGVVFVDGFVFCTLCGMEKVYSRNEVLQMMYENTSNSLKIISETVASWGLNGDEIIEYLLELHEVLGAQAVTISLRKDLGYEFPVGDDIVG